MPQSIPRNINKTCAARSPKYIFQLLNLLLTTFTRYAVMLIDNFQCFNFHNKFV